MVSENSYTNLLEKKNPDAVYLPEGGYRFTLKTKAGHSTASKEVESDCTVNFSIKKDTNEEKGKNSNEESEETDKPYKNGEKQGIKVDSEVLDEEDSDSEAKETGEQATENLEKEHEDREKEEKLSLIEKLKGFLGF